MPRIPALAVALLATALALPHASAADPVLDGKRVKAYAFTANVADPQVHPIAETVGVEGVDTEVSTECAKPRCYGFPFVIRPARGVNPKTPVSLKVSWTLPTSRFWLYLVDLNKKTPVQRTFCATFYVTKGTSATIRVPSLKPGKYAAWVSVQQLVAPDTITGSVSFPATHNVGANPGPSPTELFLHGCNA